jgi:hypothetical protein
MNLITSPDVGTGQYFDGLRPTRANPQAYEEASRERLRTIATELTRAP